MTLVQGSPNTKVRIRTHSGSYFRYHIRLFSQSPQSCKTHHTKLKSRSYICAARFFNGQSCEKRMRLCCRVNYKAKTNPLCPRVSTPSCRIAIHHAICAEFETHYYLLYNPFDLQSISYRLKTPKRWELFLPTSKNLFNHHTWKIPSPIKTPIWNMLHHLTLAFVLSAVFRWVLSRRTM